MSVMSSGSSRFSPSTISDASSLPWSVAYSSPSALAASSQSSRRIAEAEQRSPATKRSTLAVVSGLLAAFALVAVAAAFAAAGIASGEPKRGVVAPEVASAAAAALRGLAVTNLAASGSAPNAPPSGGEPIGVGFRTTFLLGIFSTRTETEAVRRRLIRETYLTPRPGLCALDEYLRSEQSQCTVVYTFVVGGNDDGPTEHTDDDAPLTLGCERIDGCLERDVTYLNIRENMEDGKTDTWFKYASHLASEPEMGESLGVDYIGKADSDTYLNMARLMKFVVEELPPAPRNLHTYGGKMWPNLQKGGLYMAGLFYFVSSDLARYVGHELTPEQRRSLREDRPTEDMDFGNYVFSSPHPIKFLDLSNLRFWRHPVKDEAEWRALTAEYGVDGPPGRKNPNRPRKKRNQINYPTIIKTWVDLGYIRAEESKP